MREYFLLEKQTAVKTKKVSIKYIL